jgi:hypothetical protein
LYQSDPLSVGLLTSSMRRFATFSVVTPCPACRCPFVSRQDFFHFRDQSSPKSDLK